MTHERFCCGKTYCTGRCGVARDSFATIVLKLPVTLLSLKLPLIELSILLMFVLQLFPVHVLVVMLVCEVGVE